MAEPAADAPLGPIDYLVVEFPDGTPQPGGFEALLDLADRRLIQILDLEFVRRDGDGVRSVPIADLPVPPGLDLGVWEGAASHLLDDDDRSLLAEEMQVGSVAVVVVFENLWVVDLVGRWAGRGGRLLFDGGVPAGDLLAALDASDGQ